MLVFNLLEKFRKFLTVISACNVQPRTWTVEHKGYERFCACLNHKSVLFLPGSWKPHVPSKHMRLFKWRHIAKDCSVNYCHLRFDIEIINLYTFISTVDYNPPYWYNTSNFPSRAETRFEREYSITCTKLPTTLWNRVMKSKLVKVFHIVFQQNLLHMENSIYSRVGRKFWYWPILA